MSSYLLPFTKSSSSIFMSSYPLLFTKSSGLYRLALCLFIIINLHVFISSSLHKIIIIIIINIHVFISSPLHKIIRPSPFSFVPFSWSSSSSIFMSSYHLFTKSSGLHLLALCLFHHHQSSCLHIISSQNHQFYSPYHIQMTNGLAYYSVLCNVQDWEICEHFSTYQLTTW